MKKNILIIVLTLLCITFGFLAFSNKKENVLEEEDVPKATHKEMLSMMIETGVDTEEYELESRSSWPTREEGYVFNSTLSRCDKGSKLSWDDELNLVLMEGTTSDRCYVYFDRYKFIVINNSNVVVNGPSVSINVDAFDGDSPINKYYYSIDNGETYVESSKNTYFINGLLIGDYNLKYYVEDDNGEKSEIISKKVSIVSNLLSDYVKADYTGIQGENGMYFHNSSLENGAGDNSYRYAGSSDTTNNFVCFGTDTETCPDDNLYRIIGVFGDQVKLIKWDYANSDLLGTDGDYKSSCSANSSYCSGTNKGTNSTADIGAYWWNYANTSATFSATHYYNVWSYSKLNTVNLNTNFINNIGSTWANKIATTTWRVGGNTWTNIAESTITTAYKNEITKPDTTIESTYPAKVALMYTSDYGFSASPNAWAKGLNSYNSYINDNWMYMGIREWTITRMSDDNARAFDVNPSGVLTDYKYSKATSYAWAVRPVFYLNSDINFVGSHTGSKMDPIRIS